ncbi:glycosyltransferase family 2 protein [Aquimarina sp. ERC-38]|uniref:glycosyltransferase family 2 protein n=1 Tax=Aquimarina sp. ERC-38 TaxID=2949996 RepID=UPI002245E469|nr:glycosyltransferase family 2 protein [Aquimarina sp. ERC-38]UZO81873.1 glycosyltransferase family 2 protein [Aquimarina sp. ERC-38]
MEREKVYIIILNYINWRDTIECLESILKTDYKNYQIIVVDNSPNEESIINLKKWAKGEDHLKIKTSFNNLIYPLVAKPLSYSYLSEEESKFRFQDETLLVIKANENLGFSAGNNVALRYILRRKDFKFCWLLNNDTVIKDNTLNEQINFFNDHADQKIGILGSKLLYYYNPEIIQAVGGKFNNKLFVSKHIGEGEPDSTQKEMFPNIDYVVGASMFVTNSFLEDVGILSEDYFLYFEELDWTYRAKEKKWTIDWCPGAVVYHKEGGAIGSSSNYRQRSYFSEINIFKSRKIFYNKFFKNTTSFWIGSIIIISNRLRRFQFRLTYNFLKTLVKKNES